MGPTPSPNLAAHSKFCARETKKTNRSDNKNKYLVMKRCIGAKMYKMGKRVRAIFTNGSMYLTNGNKIKRSGSPKCIPPKSKRRRFWRRRLFLGREKFNTELPSAHKPSRPSLPGRYSFLWARRSDRCCIVRCPGVKKFGIRFCPPGRLP